MKKIIQLLQEKGTIDRIQKSVNLAGNPTDEISQEVINHAVGNLLKFEFEHDEELGEAFCNYAFDKALDEVVGTLDIRFDPNSREAQEKPLTVQLLETIINNILR